MRMNITDIASNRYVAGQLFDVILRVTASLSKIVGDDYVTMFVFMAILRANVQHLNVSNVISDAAQGGVFPNEARRPVSIQSIALSTGIPYETVRRHIHKLVESGLVVRDGSRKFMVPSEVIYGESMTHVSELAALQSINLTVRICSEIFSKKAGLASE